MYCHICGILFPFVRILGSIGCTNIIDELLNVVRGRRKQELIIPGEKAQS